MRRAGLLGLVLTATVGGLAAANLRRDGAPVQLDWTLLKAPPREVSLETPGRGEIVQTITAPGEVELVDEAEIASQVVGRVVELNVQDGQRVKAGEVLVRLDDTDARARLDSAKAQIARLRAAIAQSEADRDKAQRDLNRLTQLAERAVVTPTELADSRSAKAKSDAALLMTQNELIEAEAMLRSSQQMLDYTVIKAPIDGVVVGLDLEVGEVVIAGTTNLPGTVMMSVGDPTRLRVRADVDETDVPMVQTGQASQIYLLADPTKPVSGSVEQVAPKGKKTGEVVSFETLVRVDAKGPSLRPGMTATVEVEVKRAKDALGVPVQAVVHRRRKDLPDTPAVRSWVERNSKSPAERVQDAEARYVKLVFVEQDGVARARPVETGISDEKRVEILGGIGPEEKVIVGPFRALDELKDGDPVVLEVEKAEE